LGAALAVPDPVVGHGECPASGKAGAFRPRNLEVIVNCLIVDDSPRFLDAARSLLEREGMTVLDMVSTSAEALQRAEELRPDVTLVDIELGEESGFELAGRLREHHRHQARVILISTHAEEDYAELIAASAACGFLPKTCLSAAAIRRLLSDCGGADEE
jgi:DNA-binding NarL/FixJ family response regulator